MVLHESPLSALTDVQDALKHTVVCTVLITEAEHEARTSPTYLVPCQCLRSTSRAKGQMEGPKEQQGELRPPMAPQHPPRRQRVVVDDKIRRVNGESELKGSFAHTLMMRALISTQAAFRLINSAVSPATDLFITAQCGAQSEPLNADASTFNDTQNLKHTCYKPGVRFQLLK